MKVDQETIRRIAHLARLNIDADNEAELKADLERILDFVEKLDEVDTEGVEPLTSMSSESNVWREDQKESHLPHDKGLKNAPNKDSDYIRVPKVLE